MGGNNPMHPGSSNRPPTPDPISLLSYEHPQPHETWSLSEGSPGDRFAVSVIVVATERLFRLGLARLLSEDDHLHVIGVSGGEPDLVDYCKATSVDVVLMELDLSVTDGLNLVRVLTSHCPDSRTVVLTSTADWRVRPAMLAGAAGVLLKDTSPEAIRAAVISVHLGGQVLCNEAARWILDEEPSTHLTQRESEVLRMVAEGANNVEIVAQLQLSQKTVRNYVSRLYHKLDLSNRAEVATYLVNSDSARTAGGADPAPTPNEPAVPGR